MTGSALSMYLQVQAALNVSCREKEMILRRLGEGLGGGMARGVPSVLRWRIYGKRSWYYVSIIFAFPGDNKGATIASIFNEIMENVERGAPRKRQTRTTDVLIF